MARGEGAHRRSEQRAAWYRDGRVLGGAAGVVVLAVAVAFFVFGSRKDATSTTALAGGAGSASASAGPSGSASGSASASASGSASGATPTATTSPSAAGVPVALEECSAGIVVAQDVLAAGKLGMAHWTEHVAAQSDYVAGRATAARTAAIWKRTRLAGPADVNRFRQPAARFARTARTCTGLDSVAAPYADEAQACAARERAAASAASAMRAVMRDWTDHQRHMAERRSGDLVAVKAQEMWIEAWRKAPVALDAMARAQAALDRAPRCSV